MGIVTVRPTVAADGSVTVPVNVEDAGVEVEVTITPVYPEKSITQQEWVELVRRTAGSIQDPTFEWPEQPPLGPTQSFD